MLGELTSASGPDEAFFRSEPFAEPMVIAGPLTSTLFVRALPADLPLPLPTDLELMVQVLDEGPGGELTYLQRGVLRASHRAIDTARSQFTNEDRIYLPYRPHAGPLSDLLLAVRLAVRDYRARTTGSALFSFGPSSARRSRGSSRSTFSR